MISLKRIVFLFLGGACLFCGIAQAQTAVSSEDAATTSATASDALPGDAATTPTGVIATPTPQAPKAKTYYIAPRGVKDALAMFESETPLETFVGTTNHVSGRVIAYPETHSGYVEVEVDAATIDTGIDLRNKHMAEERWLDIERHPKIYFKSEEVRFEEDLTAEAHGLSEEEYEALNSEEKAAMTVVERYGVSGMITIKGITKSLETDVIVKSIPRSELTEEKGFGAGDVAHFETQFEIKLSEFGIDVEPGNLSVSNRISIAFDVFAGADPGRLRERVMGGERSPQ